MPEDQTPVIASFITAVFQIIFMAMLYVLLQGTVGFPIQFFVALFLVSLATSAGVYYLTRKRVTAIILYMLLLSVINVLVLAFFGSLIGIELGVKELGFLVLMSMSSGALASWLGASVISKIGATGEEGFLAIHELDEKKRRILRNED